jgi:hypothetical protein
MWKGQTVAVLASGPSMSQAVADAVHAAGIPAIVTNDTFRLAPWAQILYAADTEWWGHTAGAKDFAGLKVSCQAVPGVLMLHNAGNVGYSPDPACVHTYGNSGAQAIQVAAKAGAARILLCGFDMHGCHWHGAHAAPLRTTSQDLYRRWVERMSLHLAGALEDQRVDVINCTPSSALKCFRVQPLEQALAACTVPAA